jgi:hypothetical protein
MAQAVVNNALGFPVLMAFNQRPKFGEDKNSWEIVVYNERPVDRARYEEIIRVITKNVTLDLFLGIITACTLYMCGALIPKRRFSMFRSLSFRNITILGGIIGSAIGAGQSRVTLQQFSIDRPLVVKKIKSSSGKAMEIVAAFVERQLDADPNSRDIECPLSHDIMFYPARVNCGNAHTFEYKAILDWLVSPNSNGTCPMCMGHVTIGALELDKNKENIIKDVVGKIFKKMEAILARLPRVNFGIGVLPNFSNVEDMNHLARQNGLFSRAPADEIVHKIENPDSLSLGETYALGYFLIHQFKPIKERIKQVHDILVRQLAGLLVNDRINNEIFQIQHDRIRDWHDNFDVIPQDCTIIRKLYQE